MDASCQVCGVVTALPDEELRGHIVDFVCVACGTPHYATRSGAWILAREKRSRLSILPPSSRSSRGSLAPETATPGEHIEDLLGLARRSLAAQELPAQRRLELDAPDSVRAKIQLADSILPLAMSTEREPPPSPSPDEPPRGRLPGPRALAILAAGVVASGVLLTVFRPAARPTAGAEERAPTFASPAPVEPPSTAQQPPAARADEPPPQPPSAAEVKEKEKKKKTKAKGGAIAGADDKPQAADSAPAATVATPEPSKSPRAPASLGDAIADAVAAGSETTAPGGAGASNDAKFSRDAAAASLREISGRISSCKSSPEDTGRSGITVTFVASGAVSAAVVDGPPFAGTPTGACIAKLFRGARVPAFSGSPVVVHRSFIVR